MSCVWWMCFSMPFSVQYHHHHHHHPFSAYRRIDSCYNTFKIFITWGYTISWILYYIKISDGSSHSEQNAPNLTTSKIQLTNELWVKIVLKDYCTVEIAWIGRWLAHSSSLHKGFKLKEKDKFITLLAIKVKEKS